MCGYRKGFSTQQALLPLIKIWKNALDQNGYGGAIFMGISKAFVANNHDLLITKLGAYGFDAGSLKLIKSYLTNRLQRTKTNISLVVGQNYFLEYLKDLYWDHVYLIFISTIYLI